MREEVGVVGVKGEVGRVEVRMRFSIGVVVKGVVGGALLTSGCVDRGKDRRRYVLRIVQFPTP